jgi:predicted transcriptional regulator
MQVLESAVGGSTKTMIMYKAFLSDRQVNEYLADLVQRRLIQQDMNMHSFFTTEKGRRFLKTHDNLREFVTT